MAELKMTPARERLMKRTADADMTLKEVSLKLDRNHAYLQQFVARGSPRVLPEDVRETLAEILGGEPNDYRDGGVPSIAPRVPDEEFLTVPVYDIRASAGAGALVSGEDPERYQAYHRDELSRLTKADTDSLAVITVGGDSMWETLHDGDKVLVDRTVQRVVKDGIYVLQYEDELFVKRCQRDFESGHIFVRSDNPAYREFRITDADKLTVIGRVIWIGRSLG